MRTAAYARYSSDQQRASSIDDQLRNIRQRCEREGWPEPVVYQDREISGARNDRAGYLSLIADASRYDVILVDDIYRLSRDSIEVAKATRRLTFAGVRVIGVSDGLDTGRKGHKADVGLRGLMGEMYLDDLRDKTHRGLTGRALAGSCAGGLPYGYRVTETGRRAIDDAQAVVVRRIFADYLSGKRARTIAAQLNREGVPSARGSTWAMSAIHGDTRRGIGILANPLYCGRMIWNRSRWEKHPETGRRVRRERPRSDWIATEHPELAIVTPADFDAVQARLRGLGVATGSRGRPARHLLSGVLRCGLCGGPMVVVNATSYGCSHAKDRGICAGLHAPIRATETALLAGVREELLSERSYARAQRAVAAELRRQAAVAPTAAQRHDSLALARRERDNILAAIRAGVITPSTRAALLEAEGKIEDAQREVAQVRRPVPMLPNLRERWRRMVNDLAARARDIGAARLALREIVGDSITLRNENGALVAEIAPSKIFMVAGACYGHSLPALRIPIQTKLGGR